MQMIALHYVKMRKLITKVTIAMVTRSQSATTRTTEEMKKKEMAKTEKTLPMMIVTMMHIQREATVSNTRTSTTTTTSMTKNKANLNIAGIST